MIMFEQNIPPLYQMPSILETMDSASASRFFCMPGDHRGGVRRVRGRERERERERVAQEG